MDDKTIDINVKSLVATVIWSIVLFIFFEPIPALVGLVAYVSILSLCSPIFVVKDKGDDKEYEKYTEDVTKHIKYETNNQYNKHSNKRYAIKSKKLKGGKK